MADYRNQIIYFFNLSGGRGHYQIFEDLKVE
jgi:hypothetical protein